MSKLTNSPPPEGECPKGEGVRHIGSISNLPALKEARKALRRNLTPAEASLWKLIKNRKLNGRKFRRQHSIGHYILDFYCTEEKIGIELDGEVHMNTAAEARDHERDEFLASRGIRILRFENRMVFDSPESLLKEIEDNFGRGKEPPRP